MRSIDSPPKKGGNGDGPVVGNGSTLWPRNLVRVLFYAAGLFMARVGSASPVTLPAAVASLANGGAQGFLIATDGEGRDFEFRADLTAFVSQGIGMSGNSDTPGGRITTLYMQIDPTDDTRFADPTQEQDDELFIQQFGVQKLHSPLLELLTTRMDLGYSATGYTEQEETLRVLSDTNTSLTVALIDSVQVFGRTTADGKHLAFPWQPHAHVTAPADRPGWTFMVDFAARLQQRSCVVTVVSDSLWTTEDFNGIDREALFAHYLAKGHGIGEFLPPGTSGDHYLWNASLLVPPCALPALRSLRQIPDGKCNVLLPDDKHTISSQGWGTGTLMAGVTGIVGLMGVAGMVWSRHRGDSKAPARNHKLVRKKAEPQPRAPKTKKAPRQDTGTPASHGGDGWAPLYSATSTSGRTINWSSTLSEVYETVQGALADCKHADQRRLVTSWSSSIARQSGARVNVLKSVCVRAVSHLQIGPAARSRLLEALGTNSEKALTALETFVDSHPDNLEAAQELAALRQHLAAPADTLMPAEPGMDTKGSLQAGSSSAQTPHAPATGNGVDTFVPCDFHALRRLGLDLVAQTDQIKRKIDYKREEILAERINDDIYIPGVRAPTHFHIGANFAHLTHSGGKKIQLFEHGQTQPRESNLRLALDHARTAERRMAKPVLDALTLITGVNIREDE